MAEASEKPIAKSGNTAEAVILSVIQKLEKYRQDEANEDMERLVKAVREILDIVRDKNSGEGRRLNFLVSDLAHTAHDALHLYNEHCDNPPYLASIMEPNHSWIGEIKKRMLELGVDEEETTELSNIRRSENDGEEDDGDEHVVGLEKDVEMLLRTWIFSESRDTEHFHIKGMAGIGKTTLARQLYNHADVIGRFKRRAWVCCSNDLTLKELFIKLIQQVAEVEDGENLHRSSLLEEMDNQSLQRMVRRHLKGMRFFIVLDDVPKEMLLDPLLGSLPKDNNRSRLLLTSHMNHRIIYYVNNIHRMEFLDSDKSWQLFLETINGGNKLTSEQKFPKSLQHKGKQMLRKCGGLPLAIKEVGKQLAEKKVSGESEWEQLLESVDFGPTLELLEPFYRNLSPGLESRFLYMAFYKENTILREEKLIHIWVAGGVVSESSNESSYFYDLINECVIEVENKSTEYRMNPLLHMISIEKAKEKLGFEILSRSNGPSQSDSCHRVIKCSRDKFNYSTNQDKHLVSLFFHGGGYFDASPSYWKSFEQLKILDLEDFGLKILPESIGSLVELRYLGLRNNYIKELPNSLGCLENLEVLDIAQNFMVEVPVVIWELGNLHHVYMSDVICRKPLKIVVPWRLRTLTYVSVDSWIYELSDMKMPSFLKKLGIKELDGNSDVSKLLLSLSKLDTVETLILRGYRFRRMPCLDELGILKNRLRTLKLDGLIARLPSYDNFPKYIYSLTLVNSCLDEDPMPILEKLHLLEHLKLRNAYTGQQMVILHRGFPRLKLLCIEELWDLRNVQLGKSAMWELEKLEILNCPYLDTLPEEIVSMRYLKEFKMVTIKKIATKIRNSDLISKIKNVSIIP